jgi:hypothetical protein
MNDNELKVNAAFDYWKNILCGKARVWMAKDDYYPQIDFYRNLDTLSILFDGGNRQEYKIRFSTSDSIFVLFGNIDPEKHHFFKVDEREPVINQPFIILRLANDSVLAASYPNRKWIDALNEEMTKYSGPYFVDTFLRRDLDKGR